MGTIYTITFVNHSPNNGTVILYQTGNGNVPNAFPLAWFAHSAAPGSNFTFQFSTDYGFTWGETGKLVPGVVFKAMQYLTANLSTSNETTLTHTDSGYRFVNQRPGPQPGSLFIEQDATLPMNVLSTGIGMSGRAVVVMNAEPNIQSVFLPEPKYWIAFGNYVAGQVLDPYYVNNPARITFPAGVFSIYAILNSNNTWTVQTTPVVSAASAE